MDQEGWAALGWRTGVTTLENLVMMSECQKLNDCFEFSRITTRHLHALSWVCWC